MELSDEKDRTHIFRRKRSNHKHHGVLIINAQNKSIDEIEQTLNNRVYSRYFNKNTEIPLHLGKITEGS